MCPGRRVVDPRGAHSRRLWKYENEIGLHVHSKSLLNSRVTKSRRGADVSFVAPEDPAVVAHQAIAKVPSGTLRILILSWTFAQFFI